MSQEKVPVNELDDLLTRAIKEYMNKADIDPEEFRGSHPELVTNLIDGPMTILEYNSWSDLLGVTSMLRLEGAEENVMVSYEPKIELPSYLNPLEGDSFLTATVKRYFRESNKLPERYIRAAGKAHFDNPTHFNSLLVRLKSGEFMNEVSFMQWASIVGPALMECLQDVVNDYSTGNKPVRPRDV
jgi:hypothetical protein